MISVMAPAMIWGGFDPNSGDLEITTLEEGDGCQRYLFTPIKADDGSVRVETELFTPYRDGKRTVLIIGEYGRKVQRDVVDRLTAKGFNVCVPDYSGVWKDTATTFPLSLDYGYYFKSGEHSFKVCPTAKETCQYLYAVIIRRAITFLKTLNKDADIVIMGIKTGVETALQVAGTDKRPIGLVCLGAAGYVEYADIPRYNENRELKLDDNLMCWLTGVSGTAYAKHIAIPAIVAVGSNGIISDIDRISALMTVMRKSDMRLTVSSGLRDNVGKNGFNTVVQWLEGVFIGSAPPELPVLEVNLNSDGELYASVKADASIRISKVKVFCSFDDNWHSTRYWEGIQADKAGNDEYLARIRVYGERELLFLYASVEYVNGLKLDGVVYFFDLRGAKVKKLKEVSNPIVYQYPRDHGFEELSDDAVIMNDNLCESVLPVGLKGLYCAKGGMITYAIGRKSNVPPTKLLQIDCYSPEKKFSFTVKVMRREGNKTAEYTAKAFASAGDSFSSVRFSPKDFKSDNYMSMTGWDGIKSLAIVERNIVIGKIMFI